MSKKLKQSLKNYFWFIIGSFIYSLAVTVFIGSNEISPGGITGIATIFNYLFSVPTGVVLLALNIPILILGFIKFGGKFIINTSFVTLIISVMLTFTETVLPVFKSDKILASVFGGVLMGLGISLIMLHGATTGGVDIVAKIINRRFRHFTVGKIMMALDVIVISLTVIAYGNFESALYSAVSIFTSSKVMDSLLYGGDKGKVIYAVTSKPEEISRIISRELARGVTLFDVKGGYTGESRKMLMCVVRVYEVAMLYDIIEKYDKNAFIVVSEAGEIIGEGFKKFN